MQRKSIVLTGKAQAECQCEDFQFDAAELKTNEAVIETSMSLISAGTEFVAGLCDQTGVQLSGVSGIFGDRNRFGEGAGPDVAECWRPGFLFRSACFDQPLFPCWNDAR